MNIKNSFPFISTQHRNIYICAIIDKELTPHTHTHTQLRIDLEVSVKSTMKRSNMKYFIISKVPMEYY